MTRKASHYRRMAKAALDTAIVSDETTAAKFRLLAADYAAEADRLAPFEQAGNAPAPPHEDALREQPRIEHLSSDHSLRK